MRKRVTATANVTPFTGVWIEIGIGCSSVNDIASHPSRVCGLKSGGIISHKLKCQSHPSRVCGLKYFHTHLFVVSPSHTLHGCVD